MREREEVWDKEMQEKERGRDFTGKPVVEGGWGLFAIHQTDRVCVCARVRSDDCDERLRFPGHFPSQLVAVFLTWSRGPTGGPHAHHSYSSTCLTWRHVLMTLSYKGRTCTRWSQEGNSYKGISPPRHADTCEPSVQTSGWVPAGKDFPHQGGDWEVFMCLRPTLAIKCGSIITHEDVKECVEPLFTVLLGCDYSFGLFFLSQTGLFLHICRWKTSKKTTTTHAHREKTETEEINRFNDWRCKRRKRAKKS